MEPIIEEGMFEGFIAIGAEGLFYIITLAFLFFSLSYVYHWLAYGTNRTKSILMLTIYLGVSAVFFIGMSLSLNTL